MMSVRKLDSAEGLRGDTRRSGVEERREPHAPTGCNRVEWSRRRDPKKKVPSLQGSHEAGCARANWVSVRISDTCMAVCIFIYRWLRHVLHPSTRPNQSHCFPNHTAVALDKCPACCCEPARGSCKWVPSASNDSYIGQPTSCLSLPGRVLILLPCPSTTIPRRTLSHKLA